MLVVEGTKIGKWTVVDPDTYILNGNRYLDCRCACGYEGAVRFHSLKNGTSTQCVGCKRAEHASKLTIAGSGWNTFYYRYQQNARNRKLDFNITKEEFKKICVLDCDYCGKPPRERVLSSSQTIVANGVDRVNSSKNYDKNNCVPCCDICNRMKMDMTRENFSAHIDAIRIHGLKKSK